MLKEVLVVEGKMDTVAVKKAVDAETIETGGFTLAPYTLAAIEVAYKKRGIIILTDPDGAGERIRAFLTGWLFLRKKHSARRTWENIPWYLSRSRVWTG